MDRAGGREPGRASLAARSPEVMVVPRAAAATRIAQVSIRTAACCSAAGIAAIPPADVSLSSPVPRAAVSPTGGAPRGNGVAVAAWRRDDRQRVIRLLPPEPTRAPARRRGSGSVVSTTRHPAARAERSPIGPRRATGPATVDRYIPHIPLPRPTGAARTRGIPGSLGYVARLISPRHPSASWPRHGW
jgi:hypothetical protein